MPCDLETILVIARKYGLPVVEDAACAVGSEFFVSAEWQAIGRPHGVIACFSFHPRKVITTGDGGMLTTNSADLKRRLDLLRQHGMSVSDRVRHASSKVTIESYELLGYNYRMTDVQAAIGRVQLRRLPQLVAERRRQAAWYGQLLASVRGLELPKEPPWARSNWQTYCVRVPAEIDQRVVMQTLLSAGVSTRRGVMCSHREPAYQKRDWRCPRSGSTLNAYCVGCDRTHCERLRNGEMIQDRGIALPLYAGLTPAQQSEIADRLRMAVSRSDGDNPAFKLTR
jgi:dTDP-4-amino-4,6-dideoxygalactose transaminase